MKIPTTEILGGSFLTSPTFDCTPGYVSELITWPYGLSPQVLAIINVVLSTWYDYGKSENPQSV